MDGISATRQLIQEAKANLQDTEGRLEEAKTELEKVAVSRGKLLGLSQRARIINAACEPPKRRG